MNLLKLSLGALVISVLSACPGGGNNNNNNEACGNGTLDTGEQCDDGNTTNGDGCSSVCIEESPANLDCPRLVELPKFCVPLAGGAPTEVGPNDDCGAGFFDNQDFDTRKLFSDTVLIKERNDPTGERPVMVLFLGVDKAVLFDSGNVTTSIPNIVGPFLNGRPVEIINTHLHGDHINNNNSNVFAGVIAIETPEVLAHCGLDANSFDTNNAATCNNALEYNPPNDQELFNNTNFLVVRVVRGGHQIDLGNGRLIEVLATPGHSETSITLHDPTHKILFTGDTLYPDDEIALVHPNGSNGADYLATAQLYASLEADIDIVVGAHSQGVMPARTLGQFLTSVQNQQDNVDAACDSGGFSFLNFP